MNDQGDVANTYFQIPETERIRAVLVGRPIEEMPIITNRICGVCPEAHHMAAAKACDAVLPCRPAADGEEKLRELLYSAFYVTDHTSISTRSAGRIL